MEPRIDKLVSIFDHKLRTELNFQYEKIGLSDKNYFYLEKIAETPGISQAQFIKILHRDKIKDIYRQVNQNSLASLTASEAKIFGDLLDKVTIAYQPHNSTEV